MGIFAEMVAYGIILYYNVNMFWKFYKLGGVKAFRKGGKPLLGEQIVEAGGQIGLKVAGIADEKLDGKI